RLPHRRADHRAGGAPLLARPAGARGGEVLTALIATLLFGLYAVPSNSVLPLPHEPGLLYFALYAPAWALALAGALGAALAAYADGWLVGWAFDRPTGDRLREEPSWRRI